MRMSTRSRYGLRALLYLADRPGLAPVPLSEIAAAEDIPAAFLERIMGGLREAGLVTATRGAAGGYRLSRAPAEITAADVVTAMENPRPLVDCLPDPAVCERSSACRARTAWRRLDEAVSGALAGVTLEELSRPDGSR